VFPNPSDGKFMINADVFSGTTRLTIQSIDGKLHKAYYFKSSEELNNHIFKVPNLPDGVYFINIENVKGTGAQKIIINKKLKR